jgi:hypothetical protein
MQTIKTRTEGIDLRLTLRLQRTNVRIGKDSQGRKHSIIEVVSRSLFELAEIRTQRFQNTRKKHRPYAPIAPFQPVTSL